VSVYGSDANSLALIEFRDPDRSAVWRRCVPVSALRAVPIDSGNSALAVRFGGLTINDLLARKGLEPSILPLLFGT